MTQSGALNGLDITLNNKIVPVDLRSLYSAVQKELKFKFSRQKTSERLKAIFMRQDKIYCIQFHVLIVKYFKL